MGSGSRVRQYQRRFFKGKPIFYEEKKKAFGFVRTFGVYEVRGAEEAGYKLLKGDEVVGTFSEALIEEDRVVFKLSRGVNLEVSEKGVREILSFEKAELCGMISADGGIRRHLHSKEKRYSVYDVYFVTVDKELVRAFNKLVEEIYNMTPHDYIGHHRTKKGEVKDHHRVTIYSKEVVNDLENLNIKGPKPYEFHVPLKYLNGEGKKAYVRGFLSGDGSVSVSKGMHYIRISSSCEEGLRGLREALIDLGFHPSEIHWEKREKVAGETMRDRYTFSIPEEEHFKFIEKIGSEKPGHIEKFKLIESINGKKKRKRKARK